MWYKTGQNEQKTLYNRKNGALTCSEI